MNEEKKLLNQLLKCSNILLKKVIACNDCPQDVRNIKLFMAHVGYSLLLFSGFSVVVEGDTFFIVNTKKPIEDE